ncbi:DUF6036 family nucleotidyltransferase [Nanoarchaeota archaeon]
MKISSKKFIDKKMLIDKDKQITIFHEINNFLKSKNITTSIYLFGGSSLISLEIIKRSTRDVDFFIFLDDEDDISEQIKEHVLRETGIELDIGVNGSFYIIGKDFTWTLPKKAYDRAKKIIQLSNLTVYALNPLDIIVMKCDRLDERDIQDITKILIVEQPSKKILKSIFQEYYLLLKGNRTSIEMIKDNFLQIVLLLRDMNVE